MRLSGGEQQRLAVARALLARPDWLFLDEATASLDEKSESELYRAIAATLPTTTLVSIGHRATLNAFHKRRIAFEPHAGAGDDRRGPSAGDISKRPSGKKVRRKNLVGCPRAVVRPAQRPVSFSAFWRASS